MIKTPKTHLGIQIIHLVDNFIYIRLIYRVLIDFMNFIDFKLQIENACQDFFPARSENAISNTLSRVNLGPPQHDSF